MSTAISPGRGEVTPKEVAESADGYLFDPDTGEVLGLAAESQSGHVFDVSTPEDADWVLQLIMVEESRIAAIESRRIAINANLDSMLVEPRGRLEFLRFRFEAQLLSQASRDIAAAGGKVKTAKYPHGRISFRSAPAKAQITDAGAALDFVMRWSPDHVKLSVGPTGVLKAVEAYREDGNDDEEFPFARVLGPREVPTIKTGIPEPKPSTTPED